MYVIEFPLPLKWVVWPPRWNPMHSIYLILPLFLSLLAASSCMMAEATPSQFRCELRKDVTPKVLYIKDQKENITLMTSYRTSHQLFTRVVALFLKEYLGYQNINYTYTNAYYPADVFRALGYNRPDDAYVLPLETIPKAMINLEMWYPPIDNRDSLKGDTYLGVVGRLGWYFPREMMHKYDVVDHWREFTDPNSNVFQIFSRSKAELKNMESIKKDHWSQKYYCEDPRCVRSVFTPKICENRQCTVLFASDFNSSSFLIKQITVKSLYVQVVWIGPNLNSEFIAKHLHYVKDGQNKSILAFHYKPDTVLQPFDLVSVAFPSCTDESAIFCQYEMHRFHKFIWQGLKTTDTTLYESLDRVMIDNKSYKELIAEYNKYPGKQGTELHLQNAACSWLKKNQENRLRWKYWSASIAKPELYVFGLFPTNETSRDRKFLDPGSVPAFEMAITAINNNDSILPNHKLKTFIVNTKCDSDIVMLEFIKMIKHSTQKKFFNKLVGIVGPACSDTVEPIAGVSKYFKMPIISYGAEGAIFSDREKYPYFFRTIPENKIFRHVYLQIFLKLKWKRIGSLTEDGHQYSEYLTTLFDLLRDNNIELNTRKYRKEEKGRDMATRLLGLKQQNYRIIIGDFYEDIARVALCEAIRLNMTANEGYLWFLPRWFSDDWYDVDALKKASPDTAMNILCTTKEMLHGLESHMTLSYKYFGDDDSLMPENISVREWKEQYQETLLKDYEGVEESDYAGFSYDAVWTYALALDKLFKQDQSFTSNLRSQKTIDRFIHYINETNFNGVSGQISFEYGPSRSTDIVVYQFRNGTYHEVGRFFPDPHDENEGYLEMEASALKWPLGELPYDGSLKCVVESFRVLFGDSTSCLSAIIGLCSFGLFLLLSPLIGIVLVVRHRYEKQLKLMEERWKDQSIFKKFEGWELSRSKVVVNRKLGEGQFGTVYGGECYIDNVGWQASAVKTLKEGSNIIAKIDFLGEAEMMKNFDHDNLVKLIGVCTESEPVYTVMEFMLYGDMKTFLLARRNLVNEQNRNDEDEVSNFRLTSMALDVARALKYLGDLKYVHRDVACRNCLVNAYRSVKLADFGMTRPLNDKSYYRFTRKGMLPVRWMAPESITEGLFTPQSDIWSYGVLLYEIITFGAFPFQGLTNSQVYDKVKSGETLPIPPKINPDLTLLLCSCWNLNPDKRITAENIVVHLENCPRLISPSLDAPQSLIPIENSTTLDLFRNQENVRIRKTSLGLNNSRALISATNSGLVVNNSNRKRSMSGNMAHPPLRTSLSEDGMMGGANNLDALNLNELMLEEIRDYVDDPLLPNYSQYISSAKFLSLSNKDIEREKELLVKKQNAKSGIWTNITPV